MFPVVTATGDAVPAEREVSIDVAVVEQFSDSGPARLRITLTNDASTARRLAFGFVPPFGPFVGTNRDGAGELHVLPRDDVRGGARLYDSAVPDEPADDCWKMADTWEILDSVTVWEADPGASVACIYALLDDSGPDACLPAGTYRFEDEWGESWWSDAEERVEDSWHSWGFELELAPQ